MTGLAIAFWTSAGLLVYAQLGYPALLWLLTRTRGAGASGNVAEPAPSVPPPTEPALPTPPPTALPLAAPTPIAAAATAPAPTAPAPGAPVANVPVPDESAPLAEGEPLEDPPPADGKHIDTRKNWVVVAR